MSTSFTLHLRAALAVATAIFLPAGALAAKADKAFEWQPTVCAPQAFPVRLLAASIQFADGKSVPLMPKSLEANGWGEVGAVSLIGSDRKALPARIDVQWFSYVERKTYGGSFVLNRNQVVAPLEKDFISPGSGARLSFEHLVIGLAPLGGVSVWWTGGGVTQEVAQFTASETKFNFLELVGSYPSVDAYSTDVIARSLPAGQVKMSGVATADMAKWLGDYRRRYPTRWSIAGAPNPRGMFVTFRNGESFFWQQLPGDTAESTVALPQSVSVRWQSAGGNARSAEMRVDEQALDAALRRASDKGSEVRLRYTIDVTEGVGRVFVGADPAGAIVMRTE